MNNSKRASYKIPKDFAHLLKVKAQLEAPPAPPTKRERSPKDLNRVPKRVKTSRVGEAAASFNRSREYDLEDLEGENYTAAEADTDNYPDFTLTESDPDPDGDEGEDPLVDLPSYQPPPLNRANTASRKSYTPEPEGLINPTPQQQPESESFTTQSKILERMNRSCSTWQKSLIVA